ncbi:dipeptide epimerase [Sandarakinorhabdus limnophila]|uniref:dipeptide epimerase n=1 Tax=Sandarakinorhabdus limnophila TaxID=210512 RepID=UPI0026F31766|nr:dipeptide epimerase [Sandarakinorhabdus limnophila]
MTDTVLTVLADDLPFARPFHISGYTFNSAPVVMAHVTRGGMTGRGEAAGVYYTGDTPDVFVDQLRAMIPAVARGLTRADLQTALPPGGARNALDCALWELESRETGAPVWAIAGLALPRALLTTLTLGADDPGEMARGAVELYPHAKALKLKLSGDSDVDIERVRAVRRARPDVWIGVDANQGYSAASIGSLIPVLMDCTVSLLEQPFARGAEAQLDGLRLPLPVAADESCLDLVELETLPGRFDVVNIKLDKCGGLTEALAIARRAAELGLKVMVGNMCGTSLSMAPGFVVGQLCDIVDLDGPIFLKHDPAPAVSYDGGLIWCGPEVWGAPAK